MTTRKQIPSWLLERLALNELPKRHRHLRSERETNADLQQQLQALDSTSAEFRIRFPEEIAMREINRRLRATPKPMGSRRLFWLPAAALVGILAVVLWRPEQNGIRLKGSPQLLLYRKSTNNPERLEHGDTVHAGDVLQLGYVATDRTYGAVISLDGRGHVTVHFPESTSPTAGRLEKKSTVWLPASYRLDDAPRFERFFLITSRASFSLNGVLVQAKRLAGSADAETKALTLEDGLEQQPFLLRKN